MIVLQEEILDFLDIVLNMGTKGRIPLCERWDVSKRLAAGGVEREGFVSQFWFLFQNSYTPIHP